ARPPPRGLRRDRSPCRSRRATRSRPSRSACFRVSYRRASIARAAQSWPLRSAGGLRAGFDDRSVRCPPTLPFKDGRKPPEIAPVPQLHRLWKAHLGIIHPAPPGHSGNRVALVQLALADVSLFVLAFVARLRARWDVTLRVGF